MTKVTCMVKKDLKLLLRENTVIILLSIFVVMTLASTGIEWSAQHTIKQVYNVASQELVKAGNPVPTLPLPSMSSLSLMKNMIIYIVLIGALLAITMGHVASINDRQAGVIRILFSKPFSRTDFFLAKVLSSSIIIFVSLFIAMIVSIISIYSMRGMSSNQVLNVCVFYLVSFVYLAGFAYIGLFFGMNSDNSTNAILFPLLLWIVITFALPEFASALYPTGSLNPVLPSTNMLDSPILKVMHSSIYPFSISEQYKALSAHIFGLSSDTVLNKRSHYSPWANLIILSAWSTLTLILSYLSAKRLNTAEGDTYE
ncbi:MAG: ABC transporter permease subunit [Deltaproteobacteria bacterium]|nr:ABC transporter permease subunit [Deltaproteobacteria bacterium]